jgi:hypothetical protein
MMIEIEHPDFPLLASCCLNCLNWYGLRGRIRGMP